MWYLFKANTFEEEYGGEVLGLTNGKNYEEAIQSITKYLGELNVENVTINWINDASVYELSKSQYEDLKNNPPEVF